MLRKAMMRKRGGRLDHVSAKNPEKQLPGPALPVIDDNVVTAAASWPQRQPHPPARSEVRPKIDMGSVQVDYNPGVTIWARRTSTQTQAAVPRFRSPRRTLPSAKATSAMRVELLRRVDKTRTAAQDQDRNVLGSPPLAGRPRVKQGASQSHCEINLPFFFKCRVITFWRIGRASGCSGWGEENPELEGSILKHYRIRI